MRFKSPYVPTHPRKLMVQVAEYMTLIAYF